MKLGDTILLLSLAESESQRHWLQSMSQRFDPTEKNSQASRPYSPQPRECRLKVSLSEY